MFRFSKPFSFLIINLILFSSFSLAYDQDNTHPALTDEIVDFYNLSFPDNQISEEFKKEMIRGAVEEDVGTRPLNHFYDPMYNKGFGGNYSSKEWARNSENQVAYYLRQTTGFAGFVKPLGAENHPADYSYERAIRDYANGNKARAFQALGHVLHLLEDANVPDHTRDDAHPPVHSMESPYEKEMAKWGPLNTNIAKPLFDKRKRIVILNSIDEYFDKVALHSNNNFFSEDTISVERYKKPDRFFGGEENGKKYIYGFDQDNSTFRLALVGRKHTRNFKEETSFTLQDDLVLDDYWVRLSNHLIPHGAGVVRLFLEQAKASEKLYSERKVEESKLGLFQKIIGAVNPFDDEMEKAEAQNNQIVSEIASDILDGRIVVDIREETKPEANISAFRNIGISQSPGITPAGSSKPTPILPLTLSPTPTVSPTLTPSVSPSPSPSASPIPTLTPTPTPASTPAVASDGGSCAEPVLKTNEPLRQVIINEIAWMGTNASTADEWLELKNNSTGEINLNCWQIIADDGAPKIKLSQKIGASGYYLLERSPDDNTIKDITADQTYTGALGNSGEILKLYDKDGNLQDVVGHKDASGAVVPWYAGDNTTKLSMERRNPNASGAESSNWHTNDGITKNGTDAGSNPIKGTPKNQNSTGTVTLGGSGGGGSSNSSSSGDSGGGGGDEDGEGGGGDINTPLFKIVINEIAWAGTGADTNDEWIELYNPTSQSVSIGSWTLKASGSFTVNLATVSFNPFGYFLLERTDDTAISDIAADQTYTGAMNNSGEILELRDNTGQLQDKVDAWQAGENNTLTTPPTRKTMERIGSGWQTNNGIIRNGLDKDGNLLFGTPKKKNSQE